MGIFCSVSYTFFHNFHLFQVNLPEGDEVEVKSFNQKRTPLTTNHVAGKGRSSCDLVQRNLLCGTKVALSRSVLQQQQEIYTYHNVRCVAIGESRHDPGVIMAHACTSCR
jgi:hypothetical protein